MALLGDMASSPIGARKGVDQGTTNQPDLQDGRSCEARLRTCSFIHAFCKFMKSRRNGWSAEARKMRHRLGCRFALGMIDNRTAPCPTGWKWCQSLVVDQTHLSSGPLGAATKGMLGYFVKFAALASVSRRGAEKLSSSQTASQASSETGSQPSSTRTKISIRRPRGLCSRDRFPS